VKSSSLTGRLAPELTFADLAARVKHGDVIITLSYRGCGHLYAEACDGDFVLHPRFTEFGYATPLFLFDQTHFDPLAENFSHDCPPIVFFPGSKCASFNFSFFSLTIVVSSFEPRIYESSDDRKATMVFREQLQTAS
jgi:hypothetical protein